MSASEPRAFVAGWPISHSRSPLIHRYWLDRYGIAGDYVREAVLPADAEQFFRSFAERGYIGGNVTIPHKGAAYSACDELTEVAERLGAVNTLWLDDGRLCGDNTDVHGFTANLDEHFSTWRTGGAALVLGAGGAARAVVQALIAAGFGRVTVLNRTAERAEALAHRFGRPVESGGLTDLPRAFPVADIVVNATSGELAGEGALAVDWTLAQTDTVVTDIVYVPLRTAFLRAAAAQGLRTVDGLGMLLHQAAPGFDRWFGRRPYVDADLRRRIIDDLG